MKNNEQQILAEIRTMMASLRQQMEMLDAKMVQLQQLTQSDDEELTPIVLDIDTFTLPVDVPSEDPVEESAEDSVEELVDESVEDPVEEQTEFVFDEPAEEPVVEVPEIAADESEEDLTEDLPSDDLPFDLPIEFVEEPTEEVVVEEPAVEVIEEPQPVAEPEPVVEPEPQPVADAVAEAEPQPVADAVAEVEPQPVAEPVEEKKPAVQEAIIDAMIEKQAWRTAMPGTPVKDVRLAISLHERVLFINHLFSEDPMAFQAAVNRVNASESLEQVVDFVKETYPQWNLESDLVYRFMMAVRRKIR